jgi:hypothetical protein
MQAVYERGRTHKARHYRYGIHVFECKKEAERWASYEGSLHPSRTLVVLPVVIPSYAERMYTPHYAPGASEAYSHMLLPEEE